MDPSNTTHSHASRWVRARDTGLAILVWLAIIYVILLAVGRVFGPLALLAMGALLAYVLTPLVDWLVRFIPRWLAITLVYLLTLALVGTLGYFIVSTAVAQFVGLSGALPGLLETAGPNNPSPVYHALHSLGLSDQQLNYGRTKVLDWLQSSALSIASQVVPILTGVAGALLDIVVVLVVSIYLVADGPRVVAWLRTGLPNHQRSRVNFTLHIINRNVGGYVRGMLTLAGLVGVVVGGGMAVIGVPYALLLGVLAFIFEFVPFVGVFISGAICVLVALTQSWITALIVLAYFVVVHVIEGEVVGPRIIGRAIGLHPVIGLIALIAGADLFGAWGALFASPIAGVIQSVIVALWTEWRLSHPEQFPSEREKIAEMEAGAGAGAHTPGVFATPDSSSLIPHDVDTPTDIRAREAGGNSDGAADRDADSVQRAGAAADGGEPPLAETGEAAARGEPPG